jgi:hypothetical protein
MSDLEALMRGLRPRKAWILGWVQGQPVWCYLWPWPPPPARIGEPRLIRPDTWRPG